MGFTIPNFIRDIESYLGAPSGVGPSATGPKFDCSGLVYRALVDLGYPDPPRDTEGQWGLVKKVNRKGLKPGDLVFSNWAGDTENPGHVQVYIGNDEVIQSPGTSTGSVDEVSLISDVGHIVGYGRLPVPSGPTGTNSDPTGPAGPVGVTNTTSPQGLSVTTPSKFTWTEGWWVTLACLSGVAFANTRVGPVIFGILTIALIFQTSLLLQGK